MATFWGALANANKGEGGWTQLNWFILNNALILLWIGFLGIWKEDPFILLASSAEMFLYFSKLLAGGFLSGWISSVVYAVVYFILGLWVVFSHTLKAYKS